VPRRSRRSHVGGFRVEQAFWRVGHTEPFGAVFVLVDDDEVVDRGQQPGAAVRALHLEEVVVGGWRKLDEGGDVAEGAIVVVDDDHPDQLVDEVGLGLRQVDARCDDRVTTEELGGGPVGDVVEADEDASLVGPRCGDRGGPAVDLDLDANVETPGDVGEDVDGNLATEAMGFDDASDRHELIGQGVLR
jgi:hypothetical protein